MHDLEGPSAEREDDNNVSVEELRIELNFLRHKLIEADQRGREGAERITRLESQLLDMGSFQSHISEEENMLWGERLKRSNQMVLRKMRESSHQLVDAMESLKGMWEEKQSSFVEEWERWTGEMKERGERGEKERREREERWEREMGEKWGRISEEREERLVKEIENLRREVERDKKEREERGREERERKERDERREREEREVRERYVSEQFSLLKEKEKKIEKNIQNFDAEIKKFKEAEERRGEERRGEEWRREIGELKETAKQMASKSELQEFDANLKNSIKKFKHQMEGDMDRLVTSLDEILTTANATHQKDVEALREDFDRRLSVHVNETANNANETANALIALRDNLMQEQRNFSEIFDETVRVHNGDCEKNLTKMHQKIEAIRKKGDGRVKLLMEETASKFDVEQIKNQISRLHQKFYSKQERDGSPVSTTVRVHVSSPGRVECEQSHSPKMRSFAEYRQKYQDQIPEQIMWEKRDTKYGRETEETEERRDRREEKEKLGEWSQDINRTLCEQMERLRLDIETLQKKMEKQQSQREEGEIGEEREEREIEMHQKNRKLYETLEWEWKRSKEEILDEIYHWSSQMKEIDEKFETQSLIVRELFDDVRRSQDTTEELHQKIDNVSSLSANAHLETSRLQSNLQSQCEQSQREMSERFAKNDIKFSSMECDLIEARAFAQKLALDCDTKYASVIDFAKEILRLDANVLETRTFADRENKETRQLIETEKGNLRTILDNGTREMRTFVEKETGEARAFAEKEVDALRTFVAREMEDVHAFVEKESIDTRLFARQEVEEMRTTWETERGDIRSQMSEEMGEMRMFAENGLNNIRRDCEREFENLRTFAEERWKGEFATVAKSIIEIETWMRKVRKDFDDRDAETVEKLRTLSEQLATMETSISQMANDRLEIPSKIQAAVSDFRQEFFQMERETLKGLSGTVSSLVNQNFDEMSSKLDHLKKKFDAHSSQMENLMSQINEKWRQRTIDERSQNPHPAPNFDETQKMDTLHKKLHHHLSDFDDFSNKVSSLFSVVFSSPSFVPGDGEGGREREREREGEGAEREKRLQERKQNSHFLGHADGRVLLRNEGTERRGEERRDKERGGEENGGEERRDSKGWRSTLLSPYEKRCSLYQKASIFSSSTPPSPQSRREMAVTENNKAENKSGQIFFTRPEEKIKKNAVRGVSEGSRLKFSMPVSHATVRANSVSSKIQRRDIGTQSPKRWISSRPSREKNDALERGERGRRDSSKSKRPETPNLLRRTIERRGDLREASNSFSKRVSEQSERDIVSREQGEQNTVPRDRREREDNSFKESEQHANVADRLANAREKTENTESSQLTDHVKKIIEQNFAQWIRNQVLTASHVNLPNLYTSANTIANANIANGTPVNATTANTNNLPANIVSSTANANTLASNANANVANANTTASKLGLIEEKTRDANGTTTGVSLGSATEASDGMSENLMVQREKGRERRETRDASSQELNYANIANDIERHEETIRMLVADLECIKKKKEEKINWTNDSGHPIYVSLSPSLPSASSPPLSVSVSPTKKTIMSHSHFGRKKPSLGRTLSLSPKKKLTANTATKTKRLVESSQQTEFKEQPQKSLGEQSLSHPSLPSTPSLPEDERLFQLHYLTLQEAKRQFYENRQKISPSKGKKHPSHQRIDSVLIKKFPPY